jgi:hypothetical protein
MIKGGYYDEFGDNVFLIHLKNLQQSQATPTLQLE